MDEQEKKFAAVKKVLGEPVICEFNANTLRIRTTLFLLSAVAIGYNIGGLKVEPGSSILGLRFEGLSDDFFRFALAGTIAYLLLHFFWCAVDRFLEWRLRITGTRVVFSPAGYFISEFGDYPNDPRQSTLYNWWVENCDSVVGMNERIAAINSKLDEIDVELERIQEDNPEAKFGSDTQMLIQIKSGILNLKQLLDLSNKLLESDRVPVSLERFDSWFKLFLKTQNMRWLLIEFALPIGLAGTALYLLICGR